MGRGRVGSDRPRPPTWLDRSEELELEQRDRDMGRKKRKKTQKPEEQAQASGAAGPLPKKSAPTQSALETLPPKCYSPFTRITRSMTGGDPILKDTMLEMDGDEMAIPPQVEESLRSAAGEKPGQVVLATSPEMAETSRSGAGGKRKQGGVLATSPEVEQSLRSAAEEKRGQGVLATSPEMAETLHSAAGEKRLRGILVTSESSRSVKRKRKAGIRAIIKTISPHSFVRSKVNDIKDCPWLNKEEFAAVYTWLYSNKTELMSKGVGRVAAWSTRGRVPVGIDITAHLCEAFLMAMKYNAGDSYQAVSFGFSVAITR